MPHSKPKEKSRVRLDPKERGTVVRVPLSDGCFAYMWANAYDFRLFGFVTDKPVAAERFFDPLDWVTTTVWQSLPAECRDVAVIPFPSGEPLRAAYYKRLDYVHPLFGSTILIRQASNGCHRAATEEEIVGLALDKGYYGFEILQWIEEHRPKMRLVTVTEAEVDRKTDLISVEKREGVYDDRETTIEIQIPEASPELFERRHELEEEIIGELQVAGCAAGDEDIEMGHGSMGDFAFDFAVTVDTKRFKTALRIVRKVLQQFKVPDSVWIQECRDDLDEPIEHPLVAPKK